jgi:hypothetical protein
MIQAFLPMLLLRLKKETEQILKGVATNRDPIIDFCMIGILAFFLCFLIYKSDLNIKFGADYQRSILISSRTTNAPQKTGI